MEKKNSKFSVNAEVIFAICIFVFYLGWMVVQPFGVAPDETMRYQIPQFIFENGFLPRGDDPALLDNVWGISYAFYPILSYMISFVFMKVVSIFTMNATALLFAARMTSVLFGVGTAVISLKIGKKLFGKRFGWVFACLVSFLPQFIFITSYVNNDSMAIFSTALIVYFWIRGIETKWDIKTCVGLSISLALCALSYYNAYGFILCSAIIYFATYFLCDKESDNYPLKSFFLKGFMIVGIFLLLAGWWFVRSAILYNGDFLARKAVSECSEIHAIDNLKPSLHVTFQNSGKSVFTMLTTTTWIVDMIISFIGCFGSMNILLPKWMYAIFGLIILVGLVFWILDAKNIFSLKGESKSKHNKWGIFSWIMLIALIIPNVLNVIYSYSSDYQPQGRYSMPMLLPLMFFLTLGFRRLLCKKVAITHGLTKSTENQEELETQDEETTENYPCEQSQKQIMATYGLMGFYIFMSLLSYFMVYLPAYINN